MSRKQERYQTKIIKTQTNMRFQSLAKRPRQFLRFTGFTPAEFTELVETIRAEWKEVRTSRLKQDRIRIVGGGAKPILTLLEDRLLVFALYAKLYLPTLYWNTFSVLMNQRSAASFRK